MKLIKLYNNGTLNESLLNAIVQTDAPISVNVIKNISDSANNPLRLPFVSSHSSNLEIIGRNNVGIIRSLNQLAHTAIVDFYGNFDIQTRFNKTQTEMLQIIKKQALLKTVQIPAGSLSQLYVLTGFKN